MTVQTSGRFTLTLSPADPLYGDLQEVLKAADRAARPETDCLISWGWPNAGRIETNRAPDKIESRPEHGHGLFYDRPAAEPVG